MRIIKYVIALAMLIGIASQVSAKDKEVKVYIFGFAASFNDSTIYLTDIQEVSGAYSDDKTGFLVNRDEYSYQLRDYIKERGNKYPTCITSYAYKKKNIQKKYEKIKKRYIEKNKGRYILVNITNKDFTYKPVSPDESAVIADTEQAKKDADKSIKKSGKNPKKKNPKKKK